MSPQNMSITVFPEVLRSIAASTFTGSYQTVGTPLVYPSRILKFTNNTTSDVTLSWDGTNAHSFLPAGSFLLIDIATNRQISNIFACSALTQFYVSASSGTGSFYIESYYAS